MNGHLGYRGAGENARCGYEDPAAVGGLSVQTYAVSTLGAGFVAAPSSALSVGSAGLEVGCTLGAVLLVGLAYFLDSPTIKIKYERKVVSTGRWSRWVDSDCGSVGYGKPGLNGASAGHELEGSKTTAGRISGGWLGSHISKL